ncbi:uncharacterized protein AMSG_01554 [Thecamonas trahens ATCC 50062]|uniref:Uncharacterized protein n=1 Tax=Thecamonas trahens ATCC 50062 TaxID=461836 RepID=A0A0L0DQX4_THETB|nr:hypothetical protein AMSG_01554 [Thecamonas trahens ATCC 50062]KNC54704.1 hypothetical protein AMSG_01554 [Thecamonas trahens ATCC 50062]|eukprot:XP_013761604.1 hypothetical protein AMSG_01554 [Thecamonas trahens ATCC 50062]
MHGPPANTAARRSRHSKDKVRLEVEAEFEEQHTFRPQLSTSSKRIDTASREERLARLAEDKSKLYVEREKLRLQREQDEAKRLAAERKRRSSARRAGVQKSLKGRRSSSSEPVQERLYRAGVEAAESRRERLVAAQSELPQQCTFKPRVSKKKASRDSSRVPLYKRVTQVQRSKNARLHKLRMEVMEGDSNLTFKPQTNSKRRTTSNRKAPVFDRLANAAQVAEARKKKLEQDLEQERAEQYTFKPKISARSKALVATSTELGGDAFLERQKRYEERSRRMKAEAQAEAEAQLAEAFQPEINALPSEVRRSREEPSDPGESFLERCERMAVKDSARAQLLRANAEEEYYSQFTFQPKINPASRALAKDRSFAQLAESTAPKAAAAGDAVEAAFSEAHPFKPKLNSTSARAKSYLRDTSNLMARIEADRRAKEKALAAARLEREAAEMEECSFAPARVTASTSPEANRARPVQVKGLDRFMELQRMREAKEAEKRELERRAFSVSHAALVGRPPTADRSPPVGSHADVIYAARAPAPSVHAQHKPKPRPRSAYVPTTNASRQRELIRKILADEDLVPIGDDDAFMFDEE